MIRDIIKDGSVYLTNKNEDIIDFNNEDIDIICKDLTQTLLNYQECVGLSAPQIGINKNIIVVKDHKSVQVMINPKIIFKSDKTSFMTEGCMSYPDVFKDIERSNEVKLEYYTCVGNKKTCKAKGLVAKIIQHEVDHLLGKCKISE